MISDDPPPQPPPVTRCNDPCPMCGRSSDRFRMKRRDWLDLTLLIAAIAVIIYVNRPQ